MNQPIHAYALYLEEDKGMSSSTLESYLRDVDKFVEFVRKEYGIREASEVRRTHVVLFVGQLKQEGRAECNDCSQHRILAIVFPFSDASRRDCTGPYV